MNAVINYLKCVFRMRSCLRVHKLLFDYVQGNLDVAMNQKLSDHLRDCPLCLKYVESYRQTITLTRKCIQPAVPMPAELETRLKDFIAREL